MKFADIVGHEKAKSRLRDMVDTDRMPHALLLHAPAGVGALAMGRALSQYIHCQNPQNGDSCGVCPACLQHQSLNNPDMHYTFPYVKKKSEGLLICDDYAPCWREFMACGPYGSWEQWLEISKAGNSQPAIYVDESAEIVRIMNMSNFSAKYKIALIWLPEKLQPETANKLLKIIEEPFADTRFILVSNDPASILPTIFSRTQRIGLSKLSDEEIVKVLTEGYGVDPALAPGVAMQANGSLADAISMVGTEGEHNEFAPLFRDMMRKAYARDVRGLRDMAESIAGMGREKIRRFLTYCGAMVRENFIYNLNTPDLLTMDNEEMKFSARFAPFINAANVERISENFAAAAADIARNANAKIVMFDTLLQLIVSIQLKP